ncbi:unnamed protein product [Enterobius vermicularis]|uniref:Chromo domain-containing protein n=1 Tax=Enterobius vermicularis TaxID=51028 RepID=A0A0N4V3M4_ENTVE|nr:unnamed protein product [Enterobius vermicularis]
MQADESGQISAKEKPQISEDHVLQEDCDSSVGEMEYEIEKILDVKAFVNEGILKYKVRWFGYDEDGDTWEPEGNLNGAKKALRNFSKTHKKDIDRERRIIEELKLAAAKSKRSGQKSFPPETEDNLAREVLEDPEMKILSASIQKGTATKNRHVSVECSLLKKRQSGNAEATIPKENNQRRRVLECIMMPDKTVHMTCRVEGTISVIPVKEAHDRFGFEVVEYMLDHAEFS